MPTLATSARSIPNLANIGERNVPKPIVKAFEERDRVRDLLADVRADRDEVAALHRQAVITDKNAAADFRLAQIGEKHEPAAPALAARLMELDEEEDVLALALSKAEDALAEALTTNLAALTKNAQKVLRERLGKMVERIEGSVAACDEMQAALNVLAFASEIEAGRVPRGRGGRLATTFEKRNGDHLLVYDALVSALAATTGFLDTLDGEPDA